MTKLEQLKEKLELSRKFEYAANVLYFDYETLCPTDAREDEGEVLGFLSNEVFKLLTSDESKQLIVDLHNEIDSIEDPLDKVLINGLYEDYEKTKNMSPEFQMEMTVTHNKAYMKWLEAKEKSDFSIYKDALADNLKIDKKAIELRDKILPNFYDNYLNDTEKGVLTADLDPFFEELKVGLLELIQKIKNSKHVIRRDFLSRNVPIHKQEEFSRYLLELNGYDFKRGALTTTEHPFTMPVAQRDARVTTHYYEDMFVSNIYSIIHEGGHAIFMQNERDEDYKHYINDDITNGMHESVSRFYENVIGRSKEYIHLIYPKFKEIFAEECPDVSEQELYEGVNIVEPSLIRTEADEVTYGLHVLIRYEMEKLICNGLIAMEDIPAKWNALYKEYLGIDVPSDKEGVLQDVHWAHNFGYFPSYQIGNCYNAMYVLRMRKEFDLDKAIETGDFKTINNWMKENVFKKSNELLPKEWIKDITGESLTPKPFLEYLNKKYSKIYQF